MVYQITFGLQYTPDQAVFIDKSSFDQWTEIQGHTWALSGWDATCKAFFIQGKQYVSVL
jgi:hypothetical protein